PRVRREHLDRDRTESYLLSKTDQRAADQLQHREERDHGFETVLGFEDQLDQLDRSLTQPISDEVQFLLQRPGAALHVQRPRRNAREHAVERRDQEVDVERFFLTTGLDRPGRRRKRERFLLRTFQKLTRYLLIGAV